MVSGPELKSYMDKRLSVELNSSRKVIGTLRGYDLFMNITLANTVEELPGGETMNIGTAVIRGNLIIALEALEKI